MSVDRLTILQGDCREVIKTLPKASVHCCVTSPPYWGLRDYGVEGQIGLEESPQAWVEKMVEVFNEVWRVLRDDGTLWLNLGDTYNGYMANQRATSISAASQSARPVFKAGHGRRTETLRAKDLLGMPWRAAFALQADGWILRSDIIWHKPNPMPESVTDRPTKAHEYIFLLSKSERYHYDADAIKESCMSNRPDMAINGIRTGLAYLQQTPVSSNHQEYNGKHRKADAQAASRRLLKSAAEARQNGAEHDSPFGADRNKRSVWTVNTAAFPEAHFATYPPDLIKPCILAGCPVGGTVLDPFGGSGTTGMVALELGRKAVLIELNPDYVKLAEQRCNVTPGLHLE